MDTEPAIVDLQNPLASTRVRTPTASDDSSVGDSNSNGRVERVIRDVKGLIRSWGADSHDKIKAPIHLDSSIGPWIVRHSGYVLTRCRIYPCGRTAMQRMKGQKSHRPILPF